MSVMPNVMPKRKAIATDDEAYYRSPGYLQWAGGVWLEHFFGEDPRPPWDEWLKPDSDKGRVIGVVLAMVYGRPPIKPTVAEVARITGINPSTIAMWRKRDDEFGSRTTAFMGYFYELVQGAWNRLGAHA